MQNRLHRVAKARGLARARFTVTLWDWGGMLRGYVGLRATYAPRVIMPAPEATR
jgi:hypothetical protein